MLQFSELSLNLARQLFSTCFVNEDLDARFVLVVSAPMQIIDPHDSRRVGKQIGFRQEIANLFGNHWCAALPATNIDRKTEFSSFVLFQVQANIMDLNSRAVAFSPGHSNLELARQERELWMNG